MRFFLLFIGLVITYSGFSQPEMPAQIPLHHEEDYAEHEGLAVECMRWLIDHSFEEEVVLRSQMNAFCMEWLAGHPQLKIETRSALMPYAQRHLELVYIHCYGAALALIDNGACDEQCYNEAGVRAVLRNSGKTKGLTQCETLDSIRIAADNNRLSVWVEERLRQ
jgi:hypothetical protein